MRRHKHTKKRIEVISTQVNYILKEISLEFRCLQLEGAEVPRVIVLVHPDVDRWGVIDVADGTSLDIAPVNGDILQVLLQSYAILPQSAQVLLLTLQHLRALLVLVLYILLHLLQSGNFGSQVDGLFDFVGEKVPGVVQGLMEAVETTNANVLLRCAGALTSILIVNGVVAENMSQLTPKTLGLGSPFL